MCKLLVKILLKIYYLKYYHFLNLALKLIYAISFIFYLVLIFVSIILQFYHVHLCSNAHIHFTNYWIKD